MSRDTWAPGTFWIATSSGPDTRSGYILHGVGLSHDGWAPLRQNTFWSLTHLGSGAAICRMMGTVAMVMPVAAEIAACGDWTLFDLPEGWSQTDPGLLEKMRAVLKKHPRIAMLVSADVAPATADDTRAVIAAREARL